jgi:hypothetical protein
MHGVVILPFAPRQVSYLLRRFVVCHDSNDAGGAVVAVELDEQIFLLPPHELRGSGEQAEADQRRDRRLLFYYGNMT